MGVVEGWACSQGAEGAVRGESGPPRKVAMRLSGKGNSNSHGARPVYQKHWWIRTSRLSKKTLSPPGTRPSLLSSLELSGLCLDPWGGPRGVGIRGSRSLPFPPPLSLSPLSRSTFDHTLFFRSQTGPYRACKKQRPPRTLRWD